MKIVHYAVVLAAICLISAFGVAGVYKMTKDRIKAKEAEATATARKAVVPAEADGLTFEDVPTDARELKGQVVKAVNAGKTVGYAAMGEAQGYSSRIKVMVGLDAKAERIVGIKIVSQQETPGLGTRIAEVKTNKTLIGLMTGKKPAPIKDNTPEFLKQFRGKTFDEVLLTSGGQGGVQGISGATISSTGAVNATRAAITKIRTAIGAQSASGS